MPSHGPHTSNRAQIERGSGIISVARRRRQLSPRAPRLAAGRLPPGISFPSTECAMHAFVSGR